MKIAIIGANGQLGSDLMIVLEGYDLASFTHKDIEINHHKKTSDILSGVRPNIVINTAAYNLVDDSEDHPETAFTTNTLAVRNLAQICERIDAVLVQISTDFVFDGERDVPYREVDPPNPVNLYGVTKLAGEYFARNTCSRYYIFRVASLFGLAGSSGKGGNFVETMVDRAKKGEKAKVVTDLIMSPAYTWDVALKMKEIILRSAPYGIYHLVNSGYCSWYEFTKAIYGLLGEGPEIEPIAISSLGLKAKRPHFSALDNENLRSIGLSDMRNWHYALEDYLYNKGYIKRKK